ncbi:hypothetical protein GGX14DRAFT_653847 [Mycena pura]|uniref:Uncharacterized protein n=1 Tax=Mycena pura TaxID=153505 RepID=A0AAD6V4M2_9AGAR|nr:hypothetical protein GGX14DRAFT_653847 [Mycena pura]
MPRGRTSAFSLEQDSHIQSFFQAALAVPKSGINAWVKETANEISKSPLFLGHLPPKSDENDNGTTLDAWIKRIERKIQNYYNRNPSTGFISFSPMSAIALFEKESRAAIAASAADRFTSTQTRMDLCYCTCQQEMWDALDDGTRAAYETRAAKVPIGVTSGEVGGLELMLFWALREDNGDLRHGIVDAHGTENTSDMADEIENWETTIPVFPSVDFVNSTASHIWEVLVEYLYQLWSYTWKDVPPHWMEIEAEPNTYYDTISFKLPASLKDPKLLGPGNAFILAEYFANTQELFVFRDRVEVEEIKSRKAPSNGGEVLNNISSEEGSSTLLPGTTEVVLPSGPLADSKKRELDAGQGSSAAGKKAKIRPTPAPRQQPSRARRTVASSVTPATGKPPKPSFLYELIDCRTNKVVGVSEGKPTLLDLLLLASLDMPSKPLPSGLTFKKKKDLKPPHPDGPPKTSAELNSERPEPAASSVSQINPEPTREPISPSVAMCGQTNPEPEFPSVTMCRQTNFEPESPNVAMCDIQPRQANPEPESPSVAMCDIKPSQTNPEPESPSVPHTFHLQGHYLSEGRVITVKHGSREVVLNTPTPLAVPPIETDSTSSKPRILRYTSLSYPYLLFVPKYDPWHGPLFDVLHYAWQDFPIVHREDGDWELRPDVAETWQNLEDCLRTVGRVIMANVEMPAPNFSAHFSPGLFRCYGRQYKTPHEARKAAWSTRTNFLPLVGLISMALWYVEDRPDAPWWEQVMEQTNVRPEWLDLLKISVAADWSIERIGGLYRVTAPDNDAPPPRTTGMEWLVSTILRSNASIPLYVIWEFLPQSIPTQPPICLQQFVPNASELEYLQTLPGAVKFRAYERDPVTSAWRQLPEFSIDTAMDVDEPNQPTLRPPTKTPERPPTPLGEFPPVVRFSGQKAGETIEAFFERRAKTNARSLAGESERKRQSRLAKEKNAQRKSCPSKSKVYVWERKNGHWIRRPAGQEKEDLWFEHSSSQRRYDSFSDEWDLCGKWGSEDSMDAEEEEEFLQDAGVLYPAKMLTNLLNSSSNTVKKTLSAYQPTRTGDPDYDPVYEPITNEAPTLQKALYYRFGLNGENYWRVPPRVPSVKTVQNLVGLPTAQISPVMQIFFGQCMDPEAQHVGRVDRKLLDFHQSPIYAQPGYFDVLYEELWNQHETSKPVTAGNMLDEVRVNYYVLRERGKPLIENRVLLIQSPTDVLEILRQRWGPTIDRVVERLVSRGMSFRLAFVSTTIERSPVSPPRHRPAVNVCDGLGFRSQGYKPDVDDYFGYAMQLNFQLLHTRRGFLALQYGGLVARLARPETDINDLLHNLDNGIPEFADCLWDHRSDHAYWFQGLTQREIKLLCGVYHIATGKADARKDGTVAVSMNAGGMSEQTRQISWWPTPSAWQTGGLDPGWWSPSCEDWFLKKRGQYESGKSEIEWTTCGRRSALENAGVRCSTPWLCRYGSATPTFTSTTSNSVRRVQPQRDPFLGHGGRTGTRRSITLECLFGAVPSCTMLGCGTGRLGTQDVAKGDAGAGDTPGVHNARGLWYMDSLFTAHIAIRPATRIWRLYRFRARRTFYLNIVSVKLAYVFSEKSVWRAQQAASTASSEIFTNAKPASRAAATSAASSWPSASWIGPFPSSAHGVAQRARDEERGAAAPPNSVHHLPPSYRGNACSEVKYASALRAVPRHNAPAATKTAGALARTEVAEPERCAAPECKRRANREALLMLAVEARRGAPRALRVRVFVAPFKLSCAPSKWRPVGESMPHVFEDVDNEFHARTRSW